MKNKTITRYLTNDTSVDNWFITTAKIASIVVGFGLAAIVPIAGMYSDERAIEKSYERWGRRKEEDETDTTYALRPIDKLSLTN